MCQGAQAVGMGVEAQTIPAAAELFKKANDILGSVHYHNLTSLFVILKLSMVLVVQVANLSFPLCSFDLLDICTNGPKEKLNSTVISQVLHGFYSALFCFPKAPIPVLYLDLLSPIQFIKVKWT